MKLCIVVLAVLMAVVYGQTRCTTDTDCHSLSCSHGEHGVCRDHGVGGTNAEKYCECARGRRDVFERQVGHDCCQASDCDAAATGCDAHTQTVTCVLAHGTGGGCGENYCKCVDKHGGR